MATTTGIGTKKKDRGKRNKKVQCMPCAVAVRTGHRSKMGHDSSGAPSTSYPKPKVVASHSWHADDKHGQDTSA